MLIALPAGAAVVNHNVPYQSPVSAGGTQLLDVYRPSNGAYLGGFTIMLIHGGSYSGGDKADFASIAAPLADLGYGVISINYTLSVNNQATFPTPVIETLNAVRWVREEGVAMGLPDRVIILGHSAGGTIGMTAAMAAQSVLASNFQSLPPSDRRGFVIDGAIGISSRADVYWNAIVGNNSAIVTYLGVGVGGANWVDVYTRATSVTYVNSCSPPTVLFHGTNDQLVPYQNSQRLATALQSHGVPVELNLTPGGTHDIAIVGATPALQAQRIAAAAQWILSQTLAICGRVPAGAAMGACCADDGSCAFTAEPDCAFAGAWRNATFCAPSPCPEAGRCCQMTDCVAIVQSACTGTWLGRGMCEASSCLPISNIGACCRGAICEITTGTACIGPNAAFAGVDQACNAAANYSAPCRFADFNRGGDVSVQDIFDFLSAWFAADFSADMTGGGTGTPGVQSIFTFLGVWFAS